MRLMGIDYGSKRVGIAFSDDGGAMAFPHTVLPNTDALHEEVAELARKEGIGLIVIGSSIDGEGKPNSVQRDIDTFLSVLAKFTDTPVTTIEERYTTQAALQIQGRTPMTDASAAALILDSYITRLKNKS